LASDPPPCQGAESDRVLSEAEIDALIEGTA
jgi:hypothetical protein